MERTGELSSLRAGKSNLQVLSRPRCLGVRFDAMIAKARPPNTIHGQCRARPMSARQNDRSVTE